MLMYWLNNLKWNNSMQKSSFVSYICFILTRHIMTYFASHALEFNWSARLNERGILIFILLFVNSMYVRRERTCNRSQITITLILILNGKSEVRSTKENLWNERMAKTDWGSESVRETNRDRGREETLRDYYGLCVWIREECWGLTHQNVISLWLSVTFLSSTSSALLCRYTLQPSSLPLHHSPASLLASPHQAHPSDEMFSGWYSWHTTQFLWIFYLGCCSKTNPMSFSSWLEIMNTAFFPDEAIVPCKSVEPHVHSHTDTPEELAVC